MALTKNEHAALRILKALSSHTRFNIVRLLVQNRDHDICVKEIAEHINMSHSATSHQLTRLERIGLLASCREGQTMCYHLSDTPTAQHVVRIVEELTEQ